MIDNESKNAITLLLGKIEEKLKALINSIRIPPLVSLFFKPSLDEALKDAPPAEKNWIRLGLGYKVFDIVPVWVILFLPFIMAAVWFGKSALQFLIEVISQFILVVPLLGLGYFIWRSIK